MLCLSAIKIPHFSVFLPCSHCVYLILTINFVCIASTALFISVPHCLTLLHYSPCVSAYFCPHFPYLTALHTSHFPHFYCTLSSNIRTPRLCLRHSLHTHTHITKSLFCVPHSSLHWSHFILAHYTDISPLVIYTQNLFYISCTIHVLYANK